MHHISRIQIGWAKNVRVLVRGRVLEESQISGSIRIVLESHNPMSPRDSSVKVNQPNPFLVPTAPMPNRYFSRVIPAASGAFWNREPGDWTASVEMETRRLATVPCAWRNGFVDLHVSEDFEEL